jgi:hypothetical protein
MGRAWRKRAVKSVVLNVRREDGGIDQHRAWPANSTAVFGPTMPWRTFRWYGGQRHYSGSYWCATTQGHVIYESRLELARLLYADFDRSVRSVLAQPFLLQAQVDGAARRHIPDFLLLREGDVPLVVEVKPRRLVDMPKVVFCLGWARQVVEAHGWQFEVWSEPPEAELANLRFLAGYRRAWLFDAGLLAKIRGRSEDLDGVAFGEAVRSVPHQPAPLVRSALLHLLWEQFFTTDLSTPLRASHRLRRSVAS